MDYTCDFHKRILENYESSPCYNHSFRQFSIVKLRKIGKFVISEEFYSLIHGSYKFLCGWKRAEYGVFDPIIKCYETVVTLIIKSAQGAGTRGTRISSGSAALKLAEPSYWLIGDGLWKRSKSVEKDQNVARRRVVSVPRDVTHI